MDTTCGEAAVTDIRTMDNALDGYELERELIELGEEKAVARGQSYLLDLNVKSVRADAYLRARRATDCTQGDATEKAYADPEYRKACEAAARATERYLLAKSRYDAKMARFEAWRTMNANKRTQLQQGIV